MALYFGYFLLKPVYFRRVDVVRVQIVGELIISHSEKYEKLEPMGQAIFRAAIMAGVLGYGSKKGQAKFWKPVCRGLING